MAGPVTNIVTLDGVEKHFGAVRALDTVQIDSAHGVTFLHAASQLANYRTLYNTLAAVALDESPSRDFILSACRDL